MQKIRVRALPAPRAGYTQVPQVVDVAAQERGLKRFVGWKHDPTLGVEFDHFVEQPDKTVKAEKRRSGGFVGTGVAEQVDVSEPEHAKHYRDALRDGDLLPADQATATWAGVPFTEPKKDAPPAEPAAPAGSDKKKGG